MSSATEGFSPSWIPNADGTTWPFNFTLPMGDQDLEARMRVRVPIVTTASALAIALGTASSLFLLGVALYHRQRERVFITFLLVSLSLACFIYSAVVLVFFIISYQQFEWPMGQMACKADQYIKYVLNYAIIYQLVLLASYMLILIRFPQCWIASQTYKVLPCVIFFVSYWIIWCCFNIETIYAYDILYYPLTGDIFCMPVYDSIVRSSIGTCLHSVFRLLVPSIFMVLSTVILFQRRYYRPASRTNCNECQSKVDMNRGIMADCRRASLWLTASFVLMRGPMDVYNFIDAIYPNMLYTVDISIVIDLLLWLYNVYFVFVPLILLLIFKNMRLTAQMWILRCRLNQRVNKVERHNSESTCVSLAVV